MIPNNSFNFKKSVKFNFNGGEISSDGGIFLFHDFLDKIGILKLLKKKFHIKTDKAVRPLNNTKLLLQFIYMTVLGYHDQTDYDTMKLEHALLSCFNDEDLGGQSAISRFVNRLTDDTLTQLEDINELLVDFYYQNNKPEYIISDIDTTNLAGYGKQEGLEYNAHYKEVGLSALAVFDQFGLFVKGELRSGETYCSNGVVDFIRPVLDKYNTEKYKDIEHLVRGDAGFATPGLYDACEDTNTKYVIKLKSNPRLVTAASEIAQQVLGANIYHEDRTFTSEFMYQADSWRQPRRVVVEIRRPKGEMVCHFFFIVTNLEARQKLVLALYRKRGNMENFIKESKNGFGITKISQAKLLSNQNQFLIKMIAYNLTKLFASSALPDTMKHHQIGTIRNKVFKIGAKKTKHSGIVIFQYASAFPLQDDFHDIVSRIGELPPTGTG
ncbi:MAG: IS1380 family transposase [Defluviitaleaceae bacterium]|nr:IS1380 family transposase [Defluviitaleaceae bacterium]